MSALIIENVEGGKQESITFFCHCMMSEKSLLSYHLNVRGNFRRHPLLQSGTYIQTEAKENSLII